MSDNHTTPEGAKAIQTVKAMKYLQAKNISFEGMDEDEILNLAGLTAAFQGQKVEADASIPQNDMGSFMSALSKL